MMVDRTAHECEILERPKEIRKTLQMWNKYSSSLHLATRRVLPIYMCVWSFESLEAWELDADVPPLAGS